MAHKNNTFELVTFLLRHAAIGIGVSWFTLAGLLYTNAGGLFSTILASNEPVLPTLLLAFGFAVTFGGAAMCIAVMHLAEDVPTWPGPRTRRVVAETVNSWFRPVRLVAQPIRRRR